MREVCGACHDLEDAAFTAAHQGGGGARFAACTSCHDPHGTAAPEAAGWVYANEHYPFAEGDCEACHDEQGRLRAEGSALCAECHEEETAGFSADDAHPLLPDQGECLECHAPHASPGKALLKEPEERLVCYRCHDASMFERDYSHLTGERTCSDCHLAHGSEHPAFLREEGDALCYSCHEDQQAQHGHPMGADATDPRTGGPVRCLSCHDPHSSPYPKHLTYDQKRDLCIQCHSVVH